SPSVGFPGGATPVQQAPENYRENNLKAMRDDAHSLYSYVKRVVALRKSFPITTRTRLHVSTSLYGAMTGYTLITKNPTYGEAARCRTIVVNMSGGGPWTLPIEHLGECAGQSTREAHVESATFAGGTLQAPLYSVGPYGKVVVDAP